MVCRADSVPAKPGAAVDAVDEIVVSGERPGPGMWHVHRGGAQLWILGSLAPLPRDITWRSKQVELVLQSTSQVLVQKPFEISIPKVLWMLLTKRSLFILRGGKRLKDVMPPPIHARFAALRAKVGEDPDKWERYRPIIAVAFLQQAAFHQVNLSMRLDLGAALRILAKNHGIRVEEVKMASIGDAIDALETLPPASENTCVEASLATLETGLPRLIERADAWATGDIERLEQLPPPEQIDVCRQAVDRGTGAADLIVRMRQSWMQAMEGYLGHDGTTVAVVNLDLLLERGGLLEQLRAKGYEIEGPN
jgi:uncharacterized protein YbaP (TraB family)